MNAQSPALSREVVGVTSRVDAKKTLSAHWYLMKVVQAGRLTHGGRLGRVWLIAAVVLLLVQPSFAQLPPDSISTRPILFVHGFYGDSNGWGRTNDPASLRGFVVTSLEISNNSGYSNTTNYDLYFDLNTVRLSQFEDPTRDPSAVGNVPPNARFFSIIFYSWNSSNPFDKYAVANVSILNKAYELAQVIGAIKQITHVKDVVVMGHSQGGLVARAYVEGLGSLFPCVDTAYAPPCTLNAVQYGGDVAHILSLDTPYGGVDASGLWADYYLLCNSQLLGACEVPSTPPLNVAELTTNSSVLQAINFTSNIGLASPQQFASTLTIDSIQSYLSDIPENCANNPLLQCFSDSVVDSVSQAARENIDPSKLSSQLTDLGNPIVSTSAQVQALFPAGCPPDPLLPPSGVWLHLISCTGAITNTQNLAYDSIFPNLSGQLMTITVRATLDTGNGPTPWPGAVQYHVQPHDSLGGSPVPGFAVPNTVDVPGGSYEVVYDGGGPSGASIQTVTPTVAIVDSVNWNITFIISFVQASPLMPSLASVTINPSVLSSGGSATVTATLSNPAPSSGAQILLSSSNQIVFPVPSSISIAPGQTVGISPTVLVGAVGAATDVNVTGAYDTVSQTATVVVNPSSKSALIISLSASQTNLMIGQSISFTATISGAINAVTPTGQAFFYDYFNGVSTQIGAGSLSLGSSGGQYVSTYSTNSLMAGQHAISVIYNGDNNYGSTISNVVTVTVQQQSQGNLTLSGFTITPSTIVGGFSPQGFVTLNGIAPTGGTVVTLTTNNSHFVQVPPTITVAPGFNTSGFPITTSFTGGAVGATISATYNGTMYGAALTVLPVGIGSVTFYPSSIAGGNTILIGVYLNGPAPAGGASVSLTSSNSTILQVPATFMVPAGATQATVSATTSPTALQMTVSVTANYNLGSGTGSLVVVPSSPPSPGTPALAFTPGTISTIVGNGTAGFLGDGGNASAAELNNPWGILTDAMGNVYIADTGNSRVRVVNMQSSPITIAGITIQAGTITTVAGNGVAGYTGDGVAATNTELNQPISLALDGAGNLYIADSVNDRIREVGPSGAITTIAGNGQAGSSGDGGPATSAEFYSPRGIALDGTGNLFIADFSANRVRAVNLQSNQHLRKDFLR